MVNETLKRIEDKISAAPAVSDKNRAELLKLVGELKGELSTLSEKDAEAAGSVAAFVEVSAGEAVRENRNQELADISLDGLSKSVTELEASDPHLTKVINSICNMLSNMGI